MTRHRCRPNGRAPGFTLIELVMIILVMAFAAAGVMSLNASIFSGQTTNAALEIGSALMQECGELILAKKQKEGIASSALATSASATTLCSGATVTVSGTVYAAPTVTITDGNSGTTGMGACPYTTNDCKLVTITQVAPPVILLLAK